MFISIGYNGSGLCVRAVCGAVYLSAVTNADADDNLP